MLQPSGPVAGPRDAARSDTPSADALRPVRLWLYAVAALIIAMVVVGGATRLTESGLSITEWKPVTGALPPLSAAEWQAEFEKYKAIPQYQILNQGMGLADFQRIYWWEWGHRLLGRLIGVAFLLPFLYFAVRGLLRGPLLRRCLGLFLLGGLQGAVGWWMVASGLTLRTSVSQYRLAVHLTLACLILAAILAVARSITPRASLSPVAPRVRWGALVLLAFVLLQIFAGGLVAGLDAGMAFNTWPLMDGRFIPPLDQLAPQRPGWVNLFENPFTAQFDHRMIAYALWSLSLVHALDARRADPAAARGAWLLFALVSAQAGLGIATLLLMVPLPVALAHQFGATLVLSAAAIHAADLAARRPETAGVPLLRVQRSR